MVGTSRSPYATLAIVYREPEAMVLVATLRAYGIEALVPAWCFISLYWHYTVFAGGIAVLVPTGDLDAAIAIVGDPADLHLPRRSFPGGQLVNIAIVIVFGLLPIFLQGTFGLLLPPRARGVYARPAGEAA